VLVTGRLPSPPISPLPPLVLRRYRGSVYTAMHHLPLSPERSRMKAPIVMAEKGRYCRMVGNFEM
jgi:hypothetical protein